MQIQKSLLPLAFLLLLLSEGAGLAQNAGQNPATPAPQLQQEAKASPPSRIAPQAQELLDKAIQALGGQAFLSFKTMSARGRTFSITEGSTSGLAPYESSVEYPDKRRLSYGKKKPVTLINNGDNAWELDRFGLTSQYPDQVHRWKISNRYSLENLLRLRIHEPGILIQKGGVDFVDNVPTTVIDIIEPAGTQAELDLHRTTFLPVRIRYRVQNSKTREWEEFSDVYSDYQTIQGIQTPMHIARFLDGERVSETFRNYAHYGDEYPPKYFEPPTR